MRKMQLTREGLERYFYGRFTRAFNRYFEVFDNEGIDTSNVLLRYNEYWTGARGNGAPAAAIFIEAVEKYGEEEALRRLSESAERPQVPVHRPFGRRLDEKDFYFMALSSCIFAAQTIVRDTDELAQRDIERRFSVMKFPVFAGVNSRFYELPEFLKYSGFEQHIDFKEGVETFREAALLAVPLVAEKLQRYFAYRGNSRFFEEELRDFFRRGLHTLTVSTSPQGLSGISFTTGAFWDYYNNKFFPHLRQYFSVSCHNGGECVLHMPDWHNNRWGSETPSDNAQENFLFSAILLYMILAEQAILDSAPEAEMDFHAATLWPQLCSGPGAGPYLHPLAMLEEARLIPRKSEALLLAEAIDVVFPIMHQMFCSMINGKSTSAFKSEEARQRFQSHFKGYGRTRLRGQIKRYAEAEKGKNMELIAAWATSPDSCMYTFLSNHNTPIQMEIRQ